jgi:threonine/homoserine/homoserine lactone efflux protein
VFTVGVISPGVLAAYAATAFVLMIKPGPDMLFTRGSVVYDAVRLIGAALRRLNVATGSYPGLAAKIATTR